MKNRFLKIAAVAAAGALAYKYVWPHIAGKDSNEPGASGSGSDMSDDLEDFKESARIKLKKAEKILADFKGKLQGADEETMQRYRETVDNLEKRGRRIAQSLADIKAEGQEGWEDIKQSFYDEFNAYKRELKDLSLENEG